MANVRPDGTTCWWTTTEDKLLRELYPTHGVDAAAAALPGHSRRAVMQRARVIGLSAPPAQRAGRFASRWPDTPELDAALGHGMPGCATLKDAQLLAASLHRPMSWLYRRCRQLKLAVPRPPMREWQPAEMRLLGEHAHRPIKEIARILRREGYRRTPSAIGLRLRRAAIDRTDPCTHTMADLAMLLGVNANTVRGWVNQYGLRAQKHQPDSGADGVQHRISRAALREWLRDNPTRINLSKVDALWFMDLALGGA